MLSNRPSPKSIEVRSLQYKGFANTLETLRRNALYQKTLKPISAQIATNTPPPILSDEAYVYNVSGSSKEHNRQPVRFEEAEEIIGIETLDFEEIDEEEESKVLTYGKGHPFHIQTEEEITPKFFYLHNFTADDYCFFKKDVVVQKLRKLEWDDDACKLCIFLISGTISFSIDQHFNNRMGIALMELIFQAFNFLMDNLFLNLDEFHEFFRNMILLYAVDDLPTSWAIFTPSECYLVAQYFTMQFDSVFLLLKTTAIPRYLLKIYVDNKMK